MPRRGRPASNVTLDGLGVVVVGASSGVGRAVALALAGHGCRLVLAARAAEPLLAAAVECRSAGAPLARPVTTDIGDPTAVRRLVDRAVDELGTVDAWVNAAAGLATGDLGRAATEDAERIARTNVVGTALLSRGALQVFERQGHGTLVNVSSLLGRFPNPRAPLYCASKFAVRGLTLSLQHGVRRRSGVRVCLVEPGPIDTPMFSRAANRTGRELRAVAPACSPHRVAAAVLSCIRRPRRHATIGVTGRALVVAHRLAPTTTERAVAWASPRLLVRRRRAEPTAGALDPAAAPTAAPHAVDGGWRRGRTRRRLGDAFGRALSRR